MSYSKDLIEKIVNKKNWPSFEKANFLQELNTIADDAIKKNTIEGCLAAILIYHQLCEEIIKYLIECSNFFIQISIYPTEICYDVERKIMFGKLLEELKKGPSFKNKQQLIDNCQKLNNIRIKIVHRLTLKSSLVSIKKQTKDVGNIYNKILEYFEVARDEYFMKFHDLEKNCEWKELLSDDD